MKRILLSAIAVSTLAACGTTAGASTTPQAARAARNAVSGQLVSNSNGTLTVSTSSGDQTVTTDSSTVVSTSATGTVADITVGVCATATGGADSSGNVSAVNVIVRPTASDGSCTLGFGGPRPSPSPGATPFPTPNFRANGPRPVSGKVASVTSGSFTLTEASGTTVTVNAPTTTKVTKVTTAALSDLSIDDCVTATGQRQSNNDLLARSITQTPAGPNGCTAGFGGFPGRGGGGGGNFGGGGGGNFGGGGGGNAVPFGG